MTTTGSKAGHGAAVSGRQSNYGDYRLPEGLAVTPSAPLYQAAAFWGWQLGRAFNRDELAEAFHISVRRAGDVMSYIRRARSDRITSRQHYVRVPGGVRMRYLHILAEPQVDGIPVVATPVHLSPAEPPDDAGATSFAALKRWFIGGAGRTSS